MKKISFLLLLSTLISCSKNDNSNSVIANPAPVYPSPTYHKIVISYTCHALTGQYWASINGADVFSVHDPYITKLSDTMTTMAYSIQGDNIYAKVKGVGLNTVNIYVDNILKSTHTANDSSETAATNY